LDLEEIKQIIELMKQNELAVFELEKGDEKLKLQRAMAPVVPPSQDVPPPPPAVSIGSAPTSSTTSPVGEGREITSPMVGTFYSAPSPESPPFVTVGSEVTPDTVVCIIEAMKVMNEIKAETTGVIAEIVAENGKPVQFGQALFRLK
jgi:acetyl-CoA carboxylase biotin carboxyl carrier protein